MTEPELIRPQWPAPGHVCAASSTRIGGVSAAPYDSLNLGARTGDDPGAVDRNRRRLRASLALPGEPVWLRQVHGNRVLALSGVLGGGNEADAAWTDRPGVVCAVLAADCLPVLLCDRDGSRVAVAHGGWRGLASGVVEQAVRALGRPAHSLIAWLGPAIGPGHFEVGPEVRERLLSGGRADGEAFKPSSKEGHWYCDLYAVARHQLHALGVPEIHGGGFCTYADRRRFYSYRRDGRTGRMATLIWIDGS